MIKAFQVCTPYNYSQKNLVVAESMAEAEILFLKKYPNTTILKILLDAEYVILPDEYVIC